MVLSILHWNPQTTVTLVGLEVESTEALAGEESWPLHGLECVLVYLCPPGRTSDEWLVDNRLIFPHQGPGGSKPRLWPVRCLMRACFLSTHCHSTHQKG